jgi:recombination protein RecA
MAKEKKEKKDLSKYLKKLDATTLNNADSRVERFIDTGSYTLNICASGSAKKGIPGDGRITLLYGDSGVGKSLFLAKICGNAQKQHEMTPFIVDTENAFDMRIASSCGMDTADAIYKQCVYIEEIKNLVAQFLQDVIENGDFGKFIIGIDSLAAPSVKELNDIEKGSESQDMGSRAKAISGLFRVLTPLAAKSKCPIVITNQTYDNPAQLTPTAFAIPSGGRKQIYMSSVAIQLRKTLEKYELDKSKKKDGDEEDADEKNTMVGISKNISGIKITAVCTKNRFVPPFTEVEMFLNFQNGLQKFGGVFECALSMGVIINKGKTYAWASDPEKSLGFKKNLIKDKDFWKVLMEKLEKVLDEKMRFSDAPSEEVDELLAETEDVE